MVVGHIPDDGDGFTSEVGVHARCVQVLNLVRAKGDHPNGRDGVTLYTSNDVVHQRRYRAEGLLWGARDISPLGVEVGEGCGGQRHLRGETWYVILMCE